MFTPLLRESSPVSPWPKEYTGGVYHTVPTLAQNCYGVYRGPVASLTPALRQKVADLYRK
jgi:hypothetical protein